MTRERPEKPDRRSRLRRILEWNLPGSLLIFRSDRSPLAWLMPELKQFDTPKHCADAFRKSYHRTVSRNPRFWLYMIGYAAVVGVFFLSPFGVHLMRRLFGPYSILIEWFMIAGFACLPLLIFQRRIQRDLRRQLFEQGRPICVECGYNLTGNKSGRCPECGWRIDRGDGRKAGSGH